MYEDVIKKLSEKSMEVDKAEKVEQPIVISSESSQDSLPSPNIEHVMSRRPIPGMAQNLDEKEETRSESVEENIAQVKVDEPLPPKTEEKPAKSLEGPAKKRKRKRIPQVSNNNSDEEVPKTQTTITDHFLKSPRSANENEKPMKSSRGRKKTRIDSDEDFCVDPFTEYEKDPIIKLKSPGSKPRKEKREPRKALQELQTRQSRRLQEKELEKYENVQEEFEMALNVIGEDKEELQELGDNKKAAASRKMNGGLTNLGNTCYMNAIIQALFALPVFISSLRCFTQLVRESQQEILQDSLLEVTQQLFESEDPEVRETLIAKFREIFIRNHNQFDNNDMQDAHEFLISLMESLRREIQVYNSWAPCPITENFEIELLNERTCRICNEKSHTTDKELTLSMTVPENRQTVQNCITQQFTSSEVEKNCDKCGENTTHDIKTRISKNPKVMIIHFQRLLTEWNKEENSIVCKKSSNTIDLSTTVSVKYVVNKEARETEAKHVLSSEELVVAKEAVEKLRVIETKKTAVVSSGIGVSDDFFKKKLGIRAVKQLTEEQQLKYAMARSLEDSDEEEPPPNDEPMLEPSSIESTSSYLPADVYEQLNDNAKIKIKEEPLINMSYGLVATINHHGKEANSGHYTSDVLNICTQRWTSFSDNRVRTIQENTVLGRRNLTYIQLFLDKDVASQIQRVEDDHCTN